VIVLGVDPGTRSGFALVADGALLASGVWQLKTENDRPGQRFRRFRDCLVSVVDLGPAAVNLIGYEQRKGQGGSYAAHLHGGIVAHIEELAERHGVPYTSVHPSTLKLWATGSGRADKALMMRAASNLAGRDITENNEADAILVALHTWETCKELVF
jgi:Holliday junction resolvasome RuvABC endonuclease subunit